MTRPTRDEGDAKLLVEAIEALRELFSRAQEANDRSFDDGQSVDVWQSDEIRAAIKRAEAVIAKAKEAIAESSAE
jgi:hypothetical protein